METEKLQKQIKILETQLQKKDEEILLLRAILKALKNVQEDRSSKEDKEKLKKLEAQIGNL